MICPYCNKLMKPGKIQVFDTLSFIPLDEKRTGFNKYGTTKNGIILSENNFDGTKQLAYLCPNCKKIILDIKSINLN